MMTRILIWMIKFKIIHYKKINEFYISNWLYDKIRWKQSWSHSTTLEDNSEGRKLHDKLQQRAFSFISSIEVYNIN